MRFDLRIDDNKIEFFFSELGHFKVVDTNKHVLGMPGDAFLSLEDFSINSLILFRGHLEEKLEDILHKEINEYVVPMSTIKAIDPNNKVILLNVAKEELKLTNKKFNAPEETIEFLRLRKLPLFSKSDEKLGRIVDIYYPIGDTCRFVVEGSELEEFLEKFRIVPNHDLIVPEHLINHLLDNDKNQINVDKIDLITNLAEVSSKNFTIDQLRENRIHFMPKNLYDIRDDMKSGLKRTLTNLNQPFSRSFPGVVDERRQKSGYYEK